MSIAHEAPAVTVEELDEAEGRDLFERACQKNLGVTADEFLAHHDVGAYPEDWSDHGVMTVEFLLPFIR